MDLEILIQDAKLDLFFMSGTGLGAVLLTVIAIAVCFAPMGSKLSFKNVLKLVELSKRLK